MAIKINARKGSILSRIFKKRYVLVISNMACGLPSVRIRKFKDLESLLNALRIRHDLDEIDLERLFRDERLRKYYDDANVTYQFNVVEVGWGQDYEVTVKNI